jgi:hypothetical protein
VRKPQGKRALRRSRSVAGKISVHRSRDAPKRRRTGSQARPSAAKPSAASSFRVAARLQRAVASELSEHVRQCRKRRHAPKVSVYEYKSAERGERVATEGTATCKSRLCTFCRVKWQRVRSGEIKTAIDFWENGGHRRVFFVTVTMRHNKSLSLGLMRRLLTKAWGSLWSGRDGQELAKKVGGKPEMIRADDDTYSFEAGWHPHGHGLMFMQDDQLTAEQLEELIAARWREALVAALETFKDQIAAVLERDRCRMWKRHRGAVRKYKKGHRVHCSPAEDPGTREVRPGYVRISSPKPSPTVEVIADDRAGMATARGQLLELMRARGTGTGEVGCDPARSRRAWNAIEWRTNYDAGKPKKAAPAFCCGDDGRGQVGIEPSVYVKRFRRRCESVEPVAGLMSPDDSKQAWEDGYAGTPLDPQSIQARRQGKRWAAPDCRAESKKTTESTDELADKLEADARDEWDWIVGTPQCWACENGQECPNMRARMEKTFGRRMVRPHCSLRESALKIEKRLRRFNKKAIEPNRKYGVKVEDARNSEGLGSYLSKMGAMSTLHLELAHGSAKLGSLGSDGLMHYSPPELQAIAATHGHEDRVAARQAYGELFRATFGLQPITFSSRDRLGLGPDPFEDNKQPAEPDERDVMLEAARVLRIAAGRVAGALIGPLPFDKAEERRKLIEEAEKIEAAAENAGETKRFLGAIDGPEFDRLMKEGEARAQAGEGECFLSELAQLHEDWQLEGAPFLEPSDESNNIPVRLKAARSPPALAGPSYGWARHLVELEIRDRVDERFTKRAAAREAAQAEGGLSGGALLDESTAKARQKLIEWFRREREHAAAQEVRNGAAEPD